MSTMKPFGPAWQKSLGTPVKGRYLTEEQICMCCGKPTRKPTLMVYASVETAVYVTKEEAHSDTFDYNMYPVGSDCAKKLKADGVKVYPYNYLDR